MMFACLALNAPRASAGSFADLVSSFPDISPPPGTSLDIAQVSSGSHQVSIEDFKSFFLVPARAAAGSSVGLRGVDYWSQRIVEFRRFYPIPGDTHSEDLSFDALGRLKLNGFLVLAVSCGWNESDVDWGQGWHDSYLFCFTPSGTLVDALPFMPPQERDWPYGGGQEIAATESLPEDPAIHQGSLDSVSVIVGDGKSITVLHRYSLHDVHNTSLITEIGKRQIGLSATGRFVDLLPRQRFFLSKVLEESTGGDPGLLCLYEGQESPQATPSFFVWQSDRDHPSVAAEMTAAPDGSLVARTTAGQTMSLVFDDPSSATFTDTAGENHGLRLKYGSGKDGEETRLPGILPMGNMYEPHSATWNYLFAPTLLPVAGGGQELFAAHSFTLGATAEDYKGSGGDAVSVGTLAGESQSTANPAVTFSPGSFCYFGEDKRVHIGVLARDAKIAWPQGGMTLAAGTMYCEREGDRAGWAIPARDTSFALTNATLKVQAGSTIRLSYGIPSSVVLPGPVQARVGSSVFWASFASLMGGYPDSLTGLLASEPATLTVGGKKVALSDTLSFDDRGRLTSGRLRADTDLSVGRKTIRFRGGYDPENPEVGMVRVFPDGRLRSGALAGAMTFQVGKSSVSLTKDDLVSFRQDGSLESCVPGTLVTVSGGGQSVLSSGGPIELRPDGGIASGIPLQDLPQAPGGLRVSTTTAACTDARVRVRAAANLEAQTLGFLDKGNTVLILERSTAQVQVGDMADYWYRVRRVSDGLTGWSFGLYLKLQE
jgi:hypothetical protein